MAAKLTRMKTNYTKELLETLKLLLLVYETTKEGAVRMRAAAEDKAREVIQEVEESIEAEKLKTICTKPKLGDRLIDEDGMPWNITTKMTLSIAEQDIREGTRFFYRKD